MLAEVLNLVETDEVSLLRTMDPIHDSNSDTALNPLLLLYSVDIDEFSEQDLPDLVERHDSIPLAKVQNEVELDIIRQMASMQSQPAIMEDYRRYVVIRSEAEVHLPSERNGVSTTLLKRLQ